MTIITKSLLKDREFNNFDYADRSSLSGTHSNHDTAVVMFQVKPDIIPSKPNVTAMNLPNSTEHFRNEPPCQRLRNYNKPKSSANLPPNFSLQKRRTTKGSP